MKRESNSLKRILVLIKIGVAMIIVLLAALVVVHYIKDKSFKASEANENELVGDIDEIPNGDDDYVEEPVYVEVLPSDLFNASTVGENESITYGIDVSKHQGTYPVVYDCEGFDDPSNRHYGIDKDKRSNIAIAFMDSVYAAGYTGVSESPTGKPDYYGQCSMWQYTDQGYVDGISGNVDLDVAYFGYDGTESAKNLSPREEATPDVEANQTFKDVDEQVTALVEVNLRDKPTICEDSNVLFTLKNGQVATRTGLGMDGWSRVEYNGQELYCVSSYIYVVE